MYRVAVWHSWQAETLLMIKIDNKMIKSHIVRKVHYATYFSEVKAFSIIIPSHAKMYTI
jgi:hypothetical protein